MFNTGDAILVYRELGVSRHFIKLNTVGHITKIKTTFSYPIFVDVLLSDNTQANTCVSNEEILKLPDKFKVAPPGYTPTKLVINDRTFWV